MTAPRHSLRRRLVLGLALASCLLWGGMALWRTHSLEDELNATLDERLVASARMVAGIVHQLQPTVPLPTDTPGAQSLAPLISRDGIACEVSPTLCPTTRPPAAVRVATWSSWMA